MIDKSVPSIPLTMFKQDASQYPRHTLPQGYEFVFYRPGDEVHWAEIEASVGQFADVEAGLASFHREFVPEKAAMLPARMLFVKDAEGDYVGTATLWYGKFLGVEYPRIHWVAVKDKCAGRGIAKAMLTRLFDLFFELGFTGMIYLLTGTRNYPAVGIYRKFGFVEYAGPKSLRESMTDEEFTAQAAQAIRIVNEKLTR